MRAIDEFCGQSNGYSKTITLRNELVPVGKTYENFINNKLLDNDKVRASNYEIVKSIIDDYHRDFIENVLSKMPSYEFDWGPLYDQTKLYNDTKDKDKKSKARKELTQLQAYARETIIHRFAGKKDKNEHLSDSQVKLLEKNSEIYGKLFSKDLLPVLIDFVKTKYKVEEQALKLEALNNFNKFWTYFTGFNENRLNMYSSEAIVTSIANRIVNENYPKFVNNVRTYEYLKDNYPKVLSDTEKSLKDFLQGKTLGDVFGKENFNNYLSQKGIDFYNTVIGGIQGEEETVRVQGINEIINITRQHLSDSEKNKLKLKMVPLYKQILSDRETVSFIPKGYEDSNEVYESVKSFHNDIFVTKKSALDKALSNISDCDGNSIYVPYKSVTEYSKTIYGAWDILKSGLLLIEKDKIKDKLSKLDEVKREAKIDELIKTIDKTDYTLVELQNAYEIYCKEYSIDITRTFKHYLAFEELDKGSTSEDKKYINIFSNYTKLYEKIDFDNVQNLLKDKDSITPIKDYLDDILNIYHFLKLTDYRGDNEKDSEYYSKLDILLNLLVNIVPLYNKVRNFVTKKPNEVKKIKLNFGCPQLANGWDANKEFDYNTILLKKDNKYFLGIFNPNCKPSFKDEEIKGSYYDKVVYKLLPGANKMLPKVFFSAKGLKTYNPPKNILEGYKAGKHKKGPGFDKQFMHDLINWFKEAINKHEDWSKFNYNFSSTDKYDDMSLFYREVEKQGYKITYKKVNETTIDSLVDSGKLYLFQIYNKDFASNTSGNKNMHTIYWENIFSEDNLKDVCIKLNGEAELFYRPKNDNVKNITHKKGSILVNRTATDGKSIPENIYTEIYKFKNGMEKTLSVEAKTLLDSGTVVCKEAKFDITKDNHFLKDKFLFHCPITLNFKAPNISNKDFNTKVLDLLKDNPDVKIIGLDRGERHLIYLTLINQKGEIELQKTLNLVDQIRQDKKVKVDYQSKLVSKEKGREKARTSWQEIGNIKDLKEGYLSQVVHEIATLMVSHNAIVVMEDLNFGFKKGRFPVERQVYQKFENMLINKLKYLAFKDRALKEKGGVLNAYQLVNNVNLVSDVGKQCGWIFYISASYTSKIDPKTGFSSLYNLSNITNKEKKKDFFVNNFTAFKYDSKEDCFVISINYPDNASFTKKWDLYTKGERLVFNKKNKQVEKVYPSKMLKETFDKYNIAYSNGQDLMETIRNIEVSNAYVEFFDNVFRAFKYTLQMRNSVPNTDEDYLVSPVMAKDGTFYDSRIEASKGDKATLPKDADANGAYHIALKGLYLLTHGFNINEKGFIENITNKEWFEFVQDKSKM